MATNLGELLDDIVESAADATPGQVVADDARLALGELGAALRRLAFDGVSRSTSDGGTDPELSRWVDELAIACMLVGDAPVAGTSPGTSPGTSTAPGRLAQLAAAAGVTATLYQDELTGTERWATTVALTDTVLGLVGSAQAPGAADPVSRLLVVVEAAGTVVSKFAAIDPPGLDDSAILDRAVPDPNPVLRTVDDRIGEAFAGLVHTTRPGTGPHSTATILAVCITAETVCRASELGTETDRTVHDFGTGGRRVGRSPHGDEPVRRRQPSTPGRQTTRRRARLGVAPRSPTGIRGVSGHFLCCGFTRDHRGRDPAVAHRAPSQRSGRRRRRRRSAVRMRA